MKLARGQDQTHWVCKLGLSLALFTQEAEGCCMQISNASIPEREPQITLSSGRDKLIYISSAEMQEGPRARGLFELFSTRPPSSGGPVNCNCSSFFSSSYEKICSVNEARAIVPSMYHWDWSACVN